MIQERKMKSIRRNAPRIYVGLTIFLALFAPVTSAQTAASPLAPNPAQAENLPPLPGHGLTQHPFLYCGEWDYIHPQQTMHLIRDGKEVWSYSIPLDVMVGTKPDKEEFSDCERLSNGNILFSRRFGASIVTPEKKIIWSYDAAPGTEIHSVQAIGLDRVLLVQNGNPAKLLLVNVGTQKVEKEIELPTPNPEKVHGQFRRVRMTSAGTYLAAHMDIGKVVEYDDTGKALWSVDAPSAWSAVRLKNGNTLITGNKNGYVRELDHSGKVVWEITKDELPGFPLATVQEASRLANGNTVICNWVAGGTKPEDWPGTVQILEVTPEKKVVWALRQWNDPNLGPATAIQLLDEPGIPENGDLQR
jgi:PQQ-like domain